MGGLVLFSTFDPVLIVQFASKVNQSGGINKLVYNASYVSANLGNGGYNGTLLYAESANDSSLLHDLKLVTSAPWREDAYSFCKNNCDGILLVESFDNFDTSVNGALHSLVMGSCNDTTSLSNDAW